VSCVISVYSLGLVRVLWLGFWDRVRVIVSITGSVSYLNEKFVVFLAFVAPSVQCQEWWRWHSSKKHRRCSISANGADVVFTHTQLYNLVARAYNYWIWASVAALSSNNFGKLFTPICLLMKLGMMLEINETFTTMTFKVVWGQGQGQEMTTVPCRDYFIIFILKYILLRSDAPSALSLKPELRIKLENKFLHALHSTHAKMASCNNETYKNRIN